MRSALLLALLSATWDTAGAQTPRIVEFRVGVSSHYKVGHWVPVRVAVDEPGSLEQPRIEIAVPDSDGVMTTASAPLTPSTMTGGPATTVVHTIVGRVGSPIRASLVDRNGTRIDERILRPGPRSVNNGPGIVELSATGELIVALSSEEFGLAEAIGASDAASGVTERRTLRLDRIDELPTEWFGYSSVNVMVISVGDGALSRELAADAARYGALARWVELGGRLVILCGGAQSKEILSAAGPLAGLIPGKWADTISLTETGPLEQFAEPAGPIGGRGRGPVLAVPKLTEVDGNIEVYAGRQASDLPLVVRSARGLGEVAFAAVDVTKRPLAEWQGRPQFLRALLRPYLSQEDSKDTSQTLVTRGYDDLSGALRQQLSRSYAGVSIVPFSAVAILAIAYLVVLGPGDYFLVRRWLRRPWIAWLTFPVIVLVFAVAALAIGDWRKGVPQAKLNWLELIDVDTISGRTRGSYWGALYSAATRQFDLAFQTADLASRDRSQPTILLSSWGLPGAGIGGMHVRSANSSIIDKPYGYGPQLDTLEGVPVLTSSTKSLTVRWTAEVERLFDAQLTDDDGLARGTIVNRTGRLLRNVRLLYGGWGYRLGNLAADGRIEVDDKLDAHRVKTIVTSAALAGSAGGSAAATQIVAEGASPLGLLNLIMFYEAAGGPAFAQLPNHYQADCDLSRHLELGRAILVADWAGTGSRLVDSSIDEPLGAEGDSGAVIIRFVLPVTKNEITR
ncbi:MAG TPA: hypothetical protein VGK58_01100 [Lacipirellulaceae bacterium]